MIIKCSKDILLSYINIVSKAVASKTTLPILECILITADEKGVRLMANNLELGIETSAMEAEIIEKGIIAIEAKIFLEIIRSLPKNELTIETDNKNIALIKSGKSEFKIMGQPGEEFPPLPAVEKNVKYETSTRILKNMIKQTIFSVAIEETKPILTGELIEIKGNDLNIVAIDGFRVSYRNTKTEDTHKPISVVVPARSLNEMSKILNDKDESMVNIYFTENHALFEMEECVMISRLLEGEFLKYEQIFAIEYTTAIDIDRMEFLSSLERATLISKDSKKNPVKIEINSEKLIITSSTELGTSYEEVNIDFEGEGLEIAFNPKYLIDALKAIEDEKISILFMSSLSPCIIKGINKDDYKYLILPLRLKN